jgi:hypothetical protein
MKTETTQTAQHTPGPWKAEGWENLVVNSADGYTMTLAAGGKWAVLSELKANARLIAAAPDLLAALREVAGLWEDSDKTNGLAEIMARSARAAIAKAMGSK